MNTEALPVLALQRDRKTPAISLDPLTGKFRIAGVSMPEESKEFYEPIQDWLRNYVEAPAKHTLFELDLEYFNTSSAKCLLDLLRVLEPLHEAGKSISVHWYYEEEDEEMEEVGTGYQEMVKLPFEMHLTER